MLLGKVGRGNGLEALLFYRKAVTLPFYPLPPLLLLLLLSYELYLSLIIYSAGGVPYDYVESFMFILIKLLVLVLDNTLF